MSGPSRREPSPSARVAIERAVACHADAMAHAAHRDDALTRRDQAFADAVELGATFRLLASSCGITEGAVRQAVQRVTTRRPDHALLGVVTPVE